MKNLDKKLKNELNKDLNELLDKVEFVSEDLEIYINSTYNYDAIDEEDLLVKLYRALGEIVYIVDNNKELCDIVYNNNEEET